MYSSEYIVPPTLNSDIIIITIGGLLSENSLYLYTYKIKLLFIHMFFYIYSTIIIDNYNSLIFYNTYRYIGRYVCIYKFRLLNINNIK